LGDPPNCGGTPPAPTVFKKTFPQNKTRGRGSWKSGAGPAQISSLYGKKGGRRYVEMCGQGGGGLFVKPKPSFFFVFFPPAAVRHGGRRANENKGGGGGRRIPPRPFGARGEGYGFVFSPRGGLTRAGRPSPRGAGPPPSGPYTSGADEFEQARSPRGDCPAAVFSSGASHEVGGGGHRNPGRAVHRKRWAAGGPRECVGDRLDFPSKKAGPPTGPHRELRVKKNFGASGGGRRGGGGGGGRGSLGGRRGPGGGGGGGGGGGFLRRLDCDKRLPFSRAQGAPARAFSRFLVVPSGPGGWGGKKEQEKKKK